MTQDALLRKRDRHIHLGRKRISRRQLRENVVGWLFIAPNWIWILVFTAYPLYASLRLSFREWNPIGVDNFVGLANYSRLLDDWVFRLAYKNALYYALLTVPTGLIWGIVIAIAVQNIRWKGFIRALYFVPTITSGVAIAVFWGWIYNPDYGLLNGLLRMVSIQGPHWLGYTKWAMPAVSLVVVWAGTGYWMVVFLAALLDIPKEYLDAARVDGASSWQTLWRVTLPLLTPTIFYYLTMAVITVWGAFDLVFVMTKGGPANATLMPALHMYNEAWTQLRMGYASAMAWVMGIIIFTLTMIHFAISRRWVHYGR